MQEVVLDNSIYKTLLSWFINFQVDIEAEFWIEAAVKASKGLAKKVRYLINEIQ